MAWPYCTKSKVNTARLNRSYFEVVEGRLLKLGDTHPHTLESIENLIDLYEAWKKPEKVNE